MRIVVAGTQNVGKTTFIKDFLKQWPMYKTPNGSYREAVEAKGIKLNKEGTLEGQEAIRDILLEQLEKNKDEKYIIFDRGPIDNLIYSMWHYAKNPTQEMDLLIEKSIVKVRESLSKYDIIFFIPLLDKYPVEIVPDKQRCTDPVYREEIDHLFKSLMKTYYDGKHLFFPAEDCPALIEIFGKPQERIEMAKLYVDPNGNPYGEDTNLISEIQDAALDEDIEAFKEHWGVR